MSICKKRVEDREEIPCHVKGSATVLQACLSTPFVENAEATLCCLHVTKSAVAYYAPARERLHCVCLAIFVVFGTCSDNACDMRTTIFPRPINVAFEVVCTHDIGSGSFEVARRESSLIIYQIVALVAAHEPSVLSKKLQ